MTYLILLVILAISYFLSHQCILLKPVKRIKASKRVALIIILINIFILLRSNPVPFLYDNSTMNALDHEPSLIKIPERILNPNQWLNDYYEYTKKVKKRKSGVYYLEVYDRVMLVSETDFHHIFIDTSSKRRFIPEIEKSYLWTNSNGKNVECKGNVDFYSWFNVIEKGKLHLTNKNGALLVNPIQRIKCSSVGFLNVEGLKKYMDVKVWTNKKAIDLFPNFNFSKPKLANPVFAIPYSSTEPMVEADLRKIKSMFREFPNRAENIKRGRRESYQNGVEMIKDYSFIPISFPRNVLVLSIFVLTLAFTVFYRRKQFTITILAVVMVGIASFNDWLIPYNHFHADMVNYNLDKLKLNLVKSLNHVDKSSYKYDQIVLAANQCQFIKEESMEVNIALNTPNWRHNLPFYSFSFLDNNESIQVYFASYQFYDNSMNTFANEYYHKIVDRVRRARRDQPEHVDFFFDTRKFYLGGVKIEVRENENKQEALRRHYLEFLQRLEDMDCPIMGMEEYDGK